jgi:hypothetical protein
MEAARFFRRDIFDEMKGYDTENIGTEDYDLPQRIQAIYGKAIIGRIDAFIYHDEGKLSLWRSCQKKFYYAQRLNNYVAKEANKQKFSTQSSVLRRYALFLSQPRKLFAHPLYGIAMLWMKTAEMASGVA